MQCVILSIGDELVLGQTVDTNSAYLAEQLTRAGIRTLYHQCIADDQAAISRAILRAAGDASLLIITGGIGPTDDDLTRQALAEAMGVELVLDSVSLASIEQYFASSGRPMPQRNRIQAMCPQGATPIVNTTGTAPGIKARLGNTLIFVTPGVPREMKEMYRLSIEPEIVHFAPRREVILTDRVMTYGMGESVVAQKLGPLMARTRNPLVGTTVSDGYVAVRLRAAFDDLDTARRELETTATQVMELIGPMAFGRGDETLAAATYNALRLHARTVTTAESCTGGILGQMLTEMSGASFVYAGGWVCYSIPMKQSQLGVELSTIEAHGLTSAEVADAMALGALERSGADYALATTGVAGPEGGTPENPVGTVWISLAAAQDGAPPRTFPMRYQFPGDRDAIRDRAAKTALQMLRLHLLGAPLGQLAWGKPQNGGI